MMTGEELKASILQLAMQGKLVDQRLEEGTGEEVLKKIEVKKAQIENAKCIRKGKRFKISDEEVPFPLPETWKWTKVGNIAVLFNGRAFKPSDWTEDGLPIVRIQNLNNDTAPYNHYNGEFDEEYHLYGGELLFAWSGTPGTSFGAHIWRELEGVLNQHIFKLLFDEENLDKHYFQFALNFQVVELIRLAHGSAGLQHVTKGVFQNTLIPIPPLAEQKRIVAKIEELMPFVDQYAVSSEKLNTLNTTFPDQMKKSILQEAVCGKLVPQDPSDEPASVLLEKIAEEKKKLIKEGKIKKQKKLPPITEDEIPFEIPESWEWVRLNTIAYKIVDGTHHSPVNTEHGEYKYITAKNIKDNGVVLDNVTYVSKDIHDEIFARCNPEKGDVLLIKDGATTGVVTVNNLNEPFSMLSSVALIKCPADIDPWYVVSVLRSDLFYRNIRHQMKGTGITRITLKQIKPMLIPIPPISEQHRIVDKLQSILDEVEKLSQ